MNRLEAIKKYEGVLPEPKAKLFWASDVTHSTYACGDNVVAISKDAFDLLLDVAEAAVRFVRAADEWDAVAHTDAEDANKNSLYRQAAICAHSLLRTALDEVLEDVPA